MFGSNYVNEHVIAEHNIRMKELTYRVYTSELLKCLAESWGATINARYADLISPAEEEEESGDEVALRVIKKLGLRSKSDGLHETESDVVA